MICNSITFPEAVIEARVDDRIECTVGKCNVVGKVVEFRIPMWQLKYDNKMFYLRIILELTTLKPDAKLSIYMPLTIHKKCISLYSVKC